MRQGFPVTVAELLVSGGRPLPAEAAAIVLEVCSKVGPGTRQGVSAPITASSVFVEADGSVSVAGGAVVEDDQTVSLLGHLLLEMLGSGHAQRPAARLEALALRAVAASQASGLARFAAEVRRFAPEDARGAVRILFERWRRGGRRPVLEDGRVPETLRRLLPEADLVEMAGMTPPLHGPGMRAGLAVFGRKLLLGAATLLLLSVLAAGYFVWEGRNDPGQGPSPRPAAVKVQPRPPRELLPGARPRGGGPSAAERSAPHPAGGDHGPRSRVDPD